MACVGLTVAEWGVHATAWKRLVGRDAGGNGGRLGNRVSFGEGGPDTEINMV